jgi:hypothetical protein
MTAALAFWQGRGKSGLLRTRCWVMPSPGDGKEKCHRKDTALPDMHNIRQGKGEMAR